MIWEPGPPNLTLQETLSCRKGVLILNIAQLHMSFGRAPQNAVEILGSSPAIKTELWLS